MAPRRRLGARVLGLAVLLAAGCINYSPRTPHSVATAGVRLRPKRFRVELLAGQVSVDVLEVSPGRRVSEVKLVPATEPACAGSRPKLEYEIIDGNGARHDALAPGTTLVVAIPPKELKRLEDDVPIRLDLRLETAAGEASCVSVPWFSDDPQDQWEADQHLAYFIRVAYKRWSWAVRQSCSDPSRPCAVRQELADPAADPNGSHYSPRPPYGWASMRRSPNSWGGTTRPSSYTSRPTPCR